MWRRLTVIIPSIVLLSVGAAATEVTDLVHHAQAADRALVHTKGVRQLRDFQEQERQVALVTRLEDRLAQTQQALDAATAQHQQDQQQIDSLKDQVAAQPVYTTGLGGGGSSLAAGTFPYGQCTWYVATRRTVTWNGNAIEWWWNARGIRPEGQAPQVGAIMVSQESWWGHVAYVEAVLSSTVFVVSEMHYAAWGIVDRRVVNRQVVPVVGFIY